MEVLISRDKFVEWNKVLIVKGEYSNVKYGIEIKNKKKRKRLFMKKTFYLIVMIVRSYDGRKFMNSAFWRELQKSCMGNLYVENKLQIKKERKIYVFLPTLEEARERNGMRCKNTIMIMILMMRMNGRLMRIG